MLKTLTITCLISLAAMASAFACGTRTNPDPAQWTACVSPPYAPSTSLLDSTPSTADEYSRYQWPMRQVLEGESYNSLFSDAPRDVKVAVIDVYPGHQNHPDLVNVYEPGINMVEGGTNTNPPVWDGQLPTYSHAHGQCVASIIASEHNSIGTAGAFHRARIIPVRASRDTLAAAIDAAVAQGAEVIHIAGMQALNDAFVPLPTESHWQLLYLWPDLGVPNVAPQRWLYRSQAEVNHVAPILTGINDAITRATWDHDVIVTTIVGNWDGRTGYTLHSSNHETIPAASSNVRGEASPFNTSSYAGVILAPGGDRRTTSFGMTFPANVRSTSDSLANEDDVMCAIGPDKYGFGSGSSFSGPYVAAAAAIIQSYLPDATAQDVRRLITRSRQPITLNLHQVNSIGGMLSLKRLKTAILAE